MPDASVTLLMLTDVWLVTGIQDGDHYVGLDGHHLEFL